MRFTIRSVPGRLHGEAAIVTGSTSGLGREIARVFAAEGAAVAVTGRDADRGEAVATSIEDAGGDAVFFAADLTDEQQCAALAENVVDRFGSLTVLVNNAVRSDDGGGGTVVDVSGETWAAVLRVNVVAAASLCRFAIPHMLDAGHGSIVNVSSRAAERGTPGQAAYSASKGALNALTRSIAMDFGRQGIRCNTVQPGYVLHERRDAVLTDERRQRLADMHLTRLATATDVALACVFLAGRESEVITGITLPVDGGSTAVRGRALG